MLYFVFATWSEPEQRSSNWVGLGCALGLGFLAKTSFILIALPVLAFWLAASHWKSLKLPPLTSQRKAGALALLIAAPWWTLNLKGAIAFAEYSRGFIATSLGTPSPATWMLWLKAVLQCLLGRGISILIGLVVATTIVALARKKLVLSGLQMAALGACGCAGLPIIAAQLSGRSHLLRIVTPAVIPLAIALGVCASVSGWTKSRIAMAVSLTLFAAQAVVLIGPVVRPNQEPLDRGFVNGTIPSRTMARFDQWDWRPALELADSCQLKRPEISVLGGGLTFNPPQIQYPWVVRAASTSNAKIAIPNVTWLWRFEEGPPQWQQVMDRANQTDMVITAPQYAGEVKERADPDDQYNAEFAERLAHDPHFQGPFLFPMGRFTPFKVAIFVKRELRCSSSTEPR
jgi:hypothetical protein